MCELKRKERKYPRPTHRSLSERLGRRFCAVGWRVALPLVLVEDVWARGLELVRQPAGADQLDLGVASTGRALLPLEGLARQRTGEHELPCIRGVHEPPMGGLVRIPTHRGHL